MTQKKIQQIGGIKIKISHLINDHPKYVLGDRF